MHIIRDISDCPSSLSGAAIAIGNFDGLHRGHQAVISAAKEAAAQTGAAVGVMTFEPHPRQFFQPGSPVFRLTPEPMKLDLLSRLQLDLSVVLPFDAELSSLPARIFAEKILVQGLNVSHVVTGSDFHFGKNRDGNPGVLRELGAEMGFGVTIVEPQGEEGEVFSSSLVRSFLSDGKPREAGEVLGYWWRVAGEVTGGDQRGHGLGFPTANIQAGDGFALKHGTYAVRVRTDAGIHGGAAYFGTRPSFDDGMPVIETFLFDFDGDLYGQVITLEFLEFLRDDEAFATPDLLIAQMRKDCDAARDVIARVEKSDPYRNGLLGAL